MIRHLFVGVALTVVVAAHRAAEAGDQSKVDARRTLNEAEEQLREAYMRQ